MTIHNQKKMNLFKIVQKNNLRKISQQFLHGAGICTAEKSINRKRKILTKQVKREFSKEEGNYKS
jgi:hypothetical protein